MKKTDIALLILIASLSAGLAYWIAYSTIGQANNQPIRVDTIEAIDTNDVNVDERIFSKDAINPTVDTTITGSDLTSFIDEDEGQSSDSLDGDGSEADGEVQGDEALSTDVE